MKKSVILSFAALAAISAVQSVKAQATVLADWTFETSLPTTAGPLSPEIGAGVATGSHSGTTAYSNPAGPGSAHSYSSTDWLVGDYYQFQVDTAGFDSIQISFDQISSSTGPGSFQLEYSTDGSTFTSVGSPYTILVNASPNTWSAGGTHIAGSAYTFDLSAVTAIDDAPTVYFRVADVSTTSASIANGGSAALATTGTDRIDNFTVTSVPEPSSVALAAIGGVACFFAIRRKK